MPFKQPEFEKPPEKPEEVEKCWELMERKTKLYENLEKWQEEMVTKLREGAKHFNMLEGEIEKISQQIDTSLKQFKAPIENKEERKVLKEASAKVISELPKEEKKKLQKLLDQLSEKYLVDLFYRKLTGDISEDERKLLMVFSETKGEILASYHPMTGEIVMNFLNSRSQEKHTEIIMYEFTHKALRELIPEERRDNIESTLIVGRAFREFLQEEKRKLSKFQKGQLLYSGLFRALDESLAY